MMMKKPQIKSLVLILLLLQLPRVITADDTTPDGATPDAATPDEITSPVTTPTPVTTPIPPDDPLTLKKFLKDVNDMRRHYAKKFHVPNMHELIWSDELTNLPVSDWEDYNPSVESFGGTFVPSYDLRETIDKDMVKYAESPDSEHWSVLFELLMPMQTFLGCIPVSDRKRCLTGPQVRNKKMFDVSGKSRKVPGSRCQTKFKNVNGLCVAKDPTKMSYFHGDPHEFVKEVNLVRRKYAKEYNVAYMHKLVWNDSLVEIAKELNWKVAWPQARITWRYVGTIYPGIIEALTQEVEEFSQKTGKDQKEYIDGKSHSVPLLELLNPHQSQIGCVYMESDPIFFNLCLLGGSGAFELWDFNTKCPKGYVMDDGLCTIPTASNKQTSKDKKGAGENEKELMERVRILESKLENDGSIATFSIFSALLCVVMFHFSD